MAAPLRRRPLAVLFVAALVAGSVLGLAAPASAHNFLVSSDPSVGQTLTKLPSRFTITTNEGLLDISGHGAGFAFEIEDASGKFYGDGCVTVTGSGMSIEPTIGPAGSYRVLWQIVSADGHIVSNTFNFTWKPSAGFAPDVGTSHPQDCGGKSGGTAPPEPTLGQNTYSAPSANLGLVLGIGGGIVALGIALAIVLLVTGRRRKPGLEGGAPDIRDDHDSDDHDSADNSTP